MRLILINQRHKLKEDTRDEHIPLPYAVSVLKLDLRAGLQDRMLRPFDLFDVHAFEKIRLAFAIELTPQ